VVVTGAVEGKEESEHRNPNGENRGWRGELEKDCTPEGSIARGLKGGPSRGLQPGVGLFSLQK